MGLLGAIALLLFIILGVIIVGGTVVPVAFNNITFAYLIVATVHLESLTVSSIINNLLVLYIGGAIILAGSIFIAVTATKACAKRAVPDEAVSQKTGSSI